MICPNCGSEISDLAAVCPNCGAPVGNNGSYAPQTEEKANTGLIILTVFFPIVGIILGIVEMNKGNKKVGKTYLFTALIVWGVEILLGGLCCCGSGILTGMSEGASSSYYSLFPALF